MNVDLDRTDLINLVMGFDPDYSQMDERYGQYYGGFNDYWKWDSHKLSQMSESDLWGFYQKLKEPIVSSVEYRLQKEIYEIEEILEDGWSRGNTRQIEAAEKELGRLLTIKPHL